MMLTAAAYNDCRPPGSKRDRPLRRGHRRRRVADAELAVGIVSEAFDVEVVEVRAGDTCRIPPHTSHWMEPDGTMDILISYFEE